MSEKLYILEDDFDRVILTEEEKNLVILMDCKNLVIYELQNNRLQELLATLKKGVKKVFLCKENTLPVECSIEMIRPFNLEYITYDNDYCLYSYIFALSPEEADLLFYKKLEFLKIYKNGSIISDINIDDLLDNSLNYYYRNIEIKIKDKFPERTIMEQERSKAMLQNLFPT